MVNQRLDSVAPAEPLGPLVPISDFGPGANQDGARLKAVHSVPLSAFRNRFAEAPVAAPLSLANSTQPGGASACPEPKAGLVFEVGMIN